MGYAVMTFAFENRLWIVRTIIESDEFITACVESGNIGIDREDSKVITSLTVFSLVVDVRTFDLYFTDREVSLEI